jgi:uncharacterized repeat protein (TIGR02543 family)
MKTKRTIITVLLTVLLISAALMVGCSSPGDGMLPSNEESTKVDNYRIPPGKGIVRFNISGDNARTILPTPTAVGSMFYSVVFEKSGASLYYPSNDNGVNPSGEYLAYSDINTTPLALTPGSYNVTVTAFSTDNSLSDAIQLAGWSSDVATPVVISNSSTTPVNANLIGFIGAGATSGIFNYSVTIPSDVGNYTTRTLRIKGYGNAYDQTFQLNDNGTATANPTLALTAGYYTVTVTVAKTDYLTKLYTYALHIYPSMTSTLTLTSTDLTLVKNVFDVDFDLNMSTGSNTNGAYNGATQHLGYGNFVLNPGNPISSAGYGFTGWNTKDDGTGDDWTFASSRVKNDVTLYVKWSPPGASGNTGFTFTFTVDDLLTSAEVTGQQILHRGNFATGSTVTLRLTDPTDDSWVISSIEWTTGGVDLSTHKNVTTGALVINNSSTFWDLLVDDIRIDVQAELASAPGVLYNATVIIPVAD